MSSNLSCPFAPPRARIHGILTWGAIVAGLLFPGSTAFAQTLWDGGSNNNNNWTTNNNWNNNTAPGNPSGSVLTFAGSTRLAPNMNANWTVDGISFAAGAGTFVLGSTSGFTLTIASSSGIVNLDDTLQTISNRVTLGAAQTWTTGAGSGNLTVSGNVDTGGFLLSTNPSTNAARVLTLSGAISGAGGLTVGGLGSTTLSGASANTYSGTTTINSGTLTLSKTAGVTSIAGNIVIGDGAGTDTLRATTANQISSTSQVTFTAGGTAATFNMTNVNQTVGSISAADATANIALGSGTLTVGGANLNTAFAGAIQGGTGGVTKTGTGTLTLSGTNTYTGITTVNAGTLSISSEANLGANPGAFNAAQLTLNGGTLNTTATFAINDANRGVTLGASGGTFNTDTSTTLTVANAIAGTGGLEKTGAGTLINSGAAANSFTGPVTVTSGILQFAKTAAVGAINNTAAVSVASGATLQFNNASLYTIETMGNISGAGTIESVGAAAISLRVNNDNLSSTFSGQIKSTTDGNLELWKMGTGNLTLSNTSSNYSGQTEIQAGTLTISSIGNLGVASSIGAPTTAANGTIAMGLTSAATLAYTGTGHSTNRVVDLAGTTTGATLDASGTGALVFTSPFTATGAGSKTLTLAGTSAAANTIQGAIVDNSGANPTSLVKTGAGTWVLSGTNTYTGTTTVNAGTLAISSEANLGSNPGAFNAAQLTLNGGTLNTTATFAIDDSNRGITIGAGGGTLNTNASTTLTVANPMAGSGTLTKSGTGNILLTASSTGFTGAVNIDAGTATVTNSNALGSGTASTTVASGAALTLQGGIGINKGTLFLAGTGVSNSGALVNASGSNSWNGNVTLTADTTVKTNSAGSDFLALGTYQALLSRPPVDATTTTLGASTLTLAGGTGTSAIYLNGRIVGTGGLVVDMNNPGDIVGLTAHLNTFTGTTQIKQGTLVPATLPNTYPYDNSAGGGTDQYYGLNGPITIGDGTGAANSAVLQIRDNGTRFQELINHTVPITLFRDGKFEVGSAQSIGTTDALINPLGQSLIFNGGNVSIGTNGLLYLAGDVKVNATAGETAVIDGVGNTLSLTIHKGALNNPPNANRTFDVVGGVGNTSDLTINATIKNGSLTKTGAGTMTITGNNSSGYEGTTTINNGILAITNSGALGQGLTNNASATTVNSGGTLQLSNNISVANEWLRLNGTGFGGNGALQNLSGNNAWTNSVFLDSDARLQSQAGTLTISGTVTSASNANLEVRGSGNTTLSGAIGTGTGGLTKEGTGTLTLSGTNTYGGATAINQGVLSLQSSSGLGSAGTGTTVASGAELQLNNTAIGGGSNILTTLSESLTISGTGVSGQGALRSVSGPNVFSGPVTIGSGGALISANSGHALTLSGGTITTNQNLTIGTVTENGNVTISGDMANGTGGLIKNGTGSLTIASGTTQTATVGRVQLNAGTLNVGNGSNSNTLNASEFDAVAGTTLTIASAGMVNVTQGAGVTSSFAGALAGSGEFSFTGASSTSVLAFTNAFSAPNLTLTLGGGTLSLATLAGGQFEFGTIHITGDTILDFNNSAGTWLRSALLVIEGGVNITVKGWAAVADTPGASTVWYATTSINAGTIGGVDQVGGSPLNQITFNNWDPNTFQTTWVSGNHDGWFDREIRPTPEPATYGAILLSGCLGLLGWRRYRSRKKAAA